MNKGNEYKELLDAYYAEIKTAEANNAPKSVIATAKRNVKTFNRIRRELNVARNDEESGLAQEEYDQITEKYRQALKENYSFFHRLNSLCKYLGQKVYNVFAEGVLEHRKETLKDSIDISNTILEKKQSKYDSKKKAYEKSAEKKFDKENTRRKSLGLDPLEKTNDNVEKFYSTHQVKTLKRLSAHIKAEKNNIENSQREVTEIEAEIGNLENKKEDYLATFKGKGKAQTALDTQIKSEIGEAKDQKVVSRKKKEELFAAAERHLKRSMDQMRAYKSSKNTGSEIRKTALKPENSKPDAGILEDMEKDNQEHERRFYIKAMREKLDDDRYPAQKERYITMLASLDPDALDDVYGAYCSIIKTGVIDKDSFIASIEYKKENPEENTKEFYDNMIYAKKQIKKSISIVKHEENRNMPDPRKEKDVIPEYELSSLEEKNVDEMPLQELDKTLDSERKIWKSLQRDLNRAQQALKKAEDKIEQNEDAVSLKVQKEYDEAEKAVNKAKEAFDKENEKFHEMKRERTSRSKAKREYLPDGINKPMAPTVDRENERNDDGIIR